MIPKYSVIVENIGCVLRTNFLSKALSRYEYYVELSQIKGSRASECDVTLYDEHLSQPVKEYRATQK